MYMYVLQQEFGAPPQREVTEEKEEEQK